MLDDACNPFREKFMYPHYQNPSRMKPFDNSTEDLPLQGFIKIGEARLRKNIIVHSLSSQAVIEQVPIRLPILC